MNQFQLIEQRQFGPLVDRDGTTFRLWAPSRSAVDLLVNDQNPQPMSKGPDGFFTARVKGAGPGTRYMFRTDDVTFPDIASRKQDQDASGWSVVVPEMPARDPSGPHRPWHEAVICEVHVGTVTPEGTFAALADKLEHFRDAGFTCLEIMPVNEFPGDRNWGYDGTLIFAPERSYGSPDDLRRLVDRAHELGLCMVLDVVYNHFGETDSFVGQYAPEWFEDGEPTPWGPAINFDQPMVRQFYCENAAMWLSDYDFDGLRFDSVHEVKTGSRDEFLTQLSEAARAAKPDCWLIIENVKNSFRWLERDAGNRPVHYRAQWNDDMHHVLAYLVSGEGKKTGYDDTSKDPFADLEKALANGFVHDPTEGDGSDGRSRGGRAAKLPPDSFITYIENHDQIGNRADSKRLSERIEPRQLDFLHFIKFLAPQIPLCFMGDEANLTSGFPFFVDLPEGPARAKREDRYKQMAEMFGDEVEEGELPEPNDPSTFAMAKLPWQDYTKKDRLDALDRFRTLARWRRERLWQLAATPCLEARTARQGNCLIVTWQFEGGALSMALNPTSSPADIGCGLNGDTVSTGEHSAHGEVLRLGAWSAVAW